MFIHFLAQTTSTSKSVSLPESILIVIRDSSWQFVGVVIALIALLFAYKQFNRKSLVYSVISKSNILSIPLNFSQKLEVKYNQNIIKSLYVVTIFLKNNGNIAIKPDDFMQAIEIRGGDNKKILSYDVIETKPENIKVNLDLNTDAKGDYIVIKPLLLNKNDSLEIQLLFEDFDKVYIQGRIIDIEKIKELDYSFNNSLYEIIIGSGALFAGLGAFLSSINQLTNNIYVPIEILFLILLVGFSLLYSIIKSKY